MAKQATVTKSPKGTTKGKGTTEAPTRKRPAPYNPKATIRVVEGDGARRVVKSLAVNYAMQAMRKWPVVGTFVVEFGKLCEKPKAMAGGEQVAGPMPGRAGQPGPTQAAAILRYLDGHEAVVVSTK
jgi:hypothetical protein